MKKTFFFNPWFAVFIAFTTVLVRLFFVHCLPDSRVVRQAQRQYWSEVPVSTTRGSIVDIYGNPLSMSVPAYSFFIDPAFWDPSNAQALNKHLPSATIKKFSSPLSGRFHWVARKLNQEDANAIAALRLPGLYRLQEKKRIYPQNNLSSHVLGFCDIDDRGLSGIEFVWDQALYSPPGIKLFIKDISGRAIDVSTRLSDLEKIEHKGKVRLTMDMRIQYIVERRLQEAVDQHNAHWGTAICMNPHTGEILALSSMPTFDPNNRTELLDTKKIFNNAVSRVYEPGSTFKPIVVAIALERKATYPSEIIKTPHKIKVADGSISESGNHSWGKLSLGDIVVKSSNVGMAQIGLRIRPFNMYNCLKEWGFGQTPGIELNGAEAGLLPSPDQWRGVVPANIAIGQGIGVTPLHLLTAINAIVNGGELLRPYIVAEVTDTKGKTVHKGQRENVRTVVTPAIAAWLRKIMREAVINGTGRSANTAVTSVAGKTGTAQVAEKGVYAKKKWVASFVGFWPYDSPQYVMLIVIGEPSKGRYYGGDVAGPVFKAIVEDMALLNL
jgi:cell division protein FtsI (penicillin-binding protein 3)/stage V sporulation protein D (sporulation-specific penicillin-binding protein)